MERECVIGVSTTFECLLHEDIKHKLQESLQIILAFKVQMRMEPSRVKHSLCLFTQPQEEAHMEHLKTSIGFHSSFNLKCPIYTIAMRKKTHSLYFFQTNHKLIANRTYVWQSFVCKCYVELSHKCQMMYVHQYQDLCETYNCM